MGRQLGMRRTVTGLFFLFLLSPCFVQAQDVKTQAQDIKAWELKTAQFKEWLDLVQGDTYKFWTRLDGTRRPHKLYVGEGFNKAELKDKEQFVEVFSHYLAGHPEKFMLIDLYDTGTGAAIGEFGWGGFKLYVTAPAQPVQAQPVQTQTEKQDKASTATSENAAAEVVDNKTAVQH
ncbi:MAG TPA: hypothetical protein VGL11_19855 [Candidatus Binatia bacterium]|jgi:hypothetical protein